MATQQAMSGLGMGRRHEHHHGMHTNQQPSQTQNPNSAQSPSSASPAATSPGAAGSPSSTQPSSGDDYQPDQSDENGDSSDSGETNPITQLLAQIQQDMQQLQEDQSLGDSSAITGDQAQLAQDEAELQSLMGAAGGGSGASPASYSDPGSSSGGGGVEPASSSGGTGSSSGSSTPSTTSGGSSYDGASTSAPSASVQANAKIVAQVAQKDGVDPTTAVATMLVESGGNNKAVGDNGTSFGLFQLHQGGELGSLSEAQADDPTTNATTAPGEFASVQKSTGLTGGALAAAAQRPADPSAYASEVNSKMAEAKSLLGEG